MSYTRTLLITVLLSFAAAGVQAATVTVTDANSDFSVTYNTDDAGAFGTLFLSNNTIFFVPDNFTAQSNNGAGFASISETLNLQLNATTPGFTFETFVLNEDGDYIANGTGTEVSASGEMRVRAGDNPATTYLDGFDFLDNGDLGPTTQQWAGSATIDQNDGWMGTTSTVFL
ncbi:MAG: hypothetical protein KJO55_06340, partial [Gammaproteobacteria bacterium]|nr:hypothetical protein [Gammaproteobacteria bacterium]